GIQRRLPAADKINNRQGVSSVTIGVTLQGAQTTAMVWPGKIFWSVVLATLAALPSAEQMQSCPININFSGANLTHWQAYTGNNKAGNGPGAILSVYDSNFAYPNGTI